MLNLSRLEKIDCLVQKLSAEKDKDWSLAIAIDLADEIMKGILPNNSEWQKQLTRNVQETGKLPKPLPVDLFRTQKQKTWFIEHPEAASARVALRHFQADDCVVESNFYWFSESATKQKISASTELTMNWEDSELTRKPDFKVGVDFFLTSDTNSLLIVLSNRQKLRVMELKGRLSNTQKQIFLNNLSDAASFNGIQNGVRQEFEPQRTIHQTLWNALQLKEVNKQFYKIVVDHFDELVEKLVHDNEKDYENAKQFSSRLLGRLLFVWFLRKMEIINETVGYFETDTLSATDYYNTKLKVLFFSTLNTSVDKRTNKDTETPYLNGGLFEPKENDFSNEVIEFPKNFFSRLYNNFDEFNFTTDESSADFELIAVDPEMLGQVFESLLASQFTEEGNNERNRTGSFYTPREIVNYMCKESLRKYLYKKINNEQLNQGIDLLLDLSDSQYLERKSTSQAELWGVNSTTATFQIKMALDEIKVLDPACGSGAYPMGMLQLLLKTYERIEKRFDPYKLKLSIIENSIFGVDIQPMAVEISRLRAWLSVIVDEHDKKNIQPLPNLDFKFICANTLISLKKGQETVFADQELDIKLSKLRDKYFNARKPENKKQYQNEYYNLTEKFDLFDESKRTHQLKTFDPFKNRFSAEFYDSHYMFGVVDGFDVVIGNPPYGANFNDKEKSYLGSKYPNVPDYESSDYFISVAKTFLAEDGFLSYIIPNTVLTNVYAKNYREELVSNWTIKEIINLSEIKVFDTAVVRNIILSLSNSKTEEFVTEFIDKMSENGEFLEGKYLSKTFLLENIDSWLNLFYLNTEEMDLIAKIKKESVKLQDFADVSQGITPYDKYRGTPLEVIQNKSYNADFKKDETFKKFLKGADVKRYGLKWNGNQWISYGEWLANPREPRFFKNPRLLFREITNPYIYCAYSDEELYNNPSIINATDFRNVDIFYVLGVSNSKLINFLHKKNSSKSNKGNFPKMLIKDVRELPIKLGDKEKQQLIGMLAKELSTSDNDSEKVNLSDRIDELVYEVYGITDEEKRLVEHNIPNDWLS